MAGGDGPAQLVSHTPLLPLAPLFPTPSIIEETAEETISSLFVCEHPGRCRPCYQVPRPCPSPWASSECAFAEPGLGPPGHFCCTGQARGWMFVLSAQCQCQRVVRRGWRINQSQSINQSTPGRMDARLHTHAQRPAGLRTWTAHAIMSHLSHWGGRGDMTVMAKRPGTCDAHV